MKIAINEALKTNTDIPAGAVIVKDGEVIAKAHNKKEELNDVSAHAEILAIKEAAQKLGNWRLSGTKMYVTLEPCPMCAAAIVNSRIEEVYFGAFDNLYGAFGSTINMAGIFGSKIKIKGGIMEKECKALLDNFFEAKR
ncbi:MAG: nucleoside deaminase [Candidatus Gastranaerophilales bacterium]|nr:nucleoside deaminase [Candidatus Gastranaerophilales bacterium]